MSINSSHILRMAKALIQRPENWCQQAYALDAEGHRVPSNSPDAVRWCAYGATMKANEFNAGIDKPYHWLREAAMKLYHVGPAYVNDGKNHLAVLMVYDLAIKLAEEAND